MPNWTTATPTRDQALSDSYNYGEWRQMALFQDVASSADNGLATGAGITMHRVPNPFTVPGVTAPVTGYCVTQLDLYASTNNTGFIAGLEVPLGTLTVSGNVFSAGATMPTRTVAGTSLQLGSLMTFLVVTTTLTATTPIITVTYTNQSGTAGQSASITLPTNALINSAFCLNRKLASGDTGVQTISNISTSAGTAGVLKIYGFMPISFGGPGNAAGSACQLIEPLSATLPIIKLLPNDIVSFYAMGTGTLQCMSALVATPET